MSRTPEENMVELARLGGELVQAVVEQEVQVLHLVQAEMDALGNLVMNPPKQAEPGATAEDEAEAAFDNMPV